MFPREKMAFPLWEICFVQAPRRQGSVYFQKISHISSIIANYAKKKRKQKGVTGCSSWRYHCDVFASVCFALIDPVMGVAVSSSYHLSRGCDFQSPDSELSSTGIALTDWSRDFHTKQSHRPRVSHQEKSIMEPETLVNSCSCHVICSEPLAWLA